MSAADSIDEVMSTPQFDSDATVAWATSCVNQASAFADTGALERRIDHPLGEISGREFLEFRVFDVTVHAWDLARSIGASDRLPSGLVDIVLDIVAKGPPGMGFGIGTFGRAPAESSPQDTLLDLTGRSPT